MLVNLQIIILKHAYSILVPQTPTSVTDVNTQQTNVTGYVNEVMQYKTAYIWSLLPLLHDDVGCGEAKHKQEDALQPFSSTAGRVLNA